MRIFIFTLALFLIAQSTADARERRQPRHIQNDVEIIATAPTLPAEVYDPAREHRNHDWLGGYGGDNYDDETAASSSQQGQDTMSRRERERRRAWLRRHRR